MTPPGKGETFFQDSSAALLDLLEKPQILQTWALFEACNLDTILLQLK